MNELQEKDRHRQEAFVCLFLFYFSYLLFLFTFPCAAISAGKTVF